MNQTAPLTRRQAREIERRTGVRPVAHAEVAQAVAASFQHDTGRIERNEVTSLVSVVPTEIIDRAAIVPAAFDGRGVTVRAAKPAALVAKQRRRAAASFAAAASAVAVATTGLLVPAAQGSNAPAAHEADLASAVDAAQAQDKAPAAEAAAPVVTTVLEAPAQPSERADTVGFEDAAVETSPTASTGTSTGSSVETSTAPSGDSGSASVETASSSFAPASYGAGSSIVETARQMIGIPYTGGNNPADGFDCSGLTQYVYGLHGISLGRSVSAQAAQATPVSDPQPGDLVIFPNLGHVGIYAGNGRIIDAPDYGRSVTERQIWSGDYYYFGRV